jgi:hypothetical protein
MISFPTHNNPSNSLLPVGATLRYNTRNTCIKSKKIIPNLYPYISSLSQYSSPFNFTIKIYVYGENFLPNGLTSVNFGNIQNINVSYINSNTLYFELNNFIFPGVYSVVAQNNINFNAKNKTANTINGMSLHSNNVEYRITHALKLRE